MTATLRKYETVLHDLKGSTFEAALAKMDPEERLHAQRLREAFKLRDDDALWIYCGLIKGMEAIFHERLSDCVAAVQEELLTLDTFPAPRSAAQNVRPDARPTRRFTPAALLASIFVSLAVFICSVAFVSGTVLMHGPEALWLPRSAASGAFTHALSCIVTTPGAGFFAALALLGVGGMMLSFCYREAAPR